MIKSLPIENILPKESLSSKKSVKTRDSSFKKVLDKTFNRENTVKHSSITDNIKQKSKDEEHKTKREIDDKSKSSSASSPHMFVASQKTGTAKTDVKSVKGSKKKSLKNEGEADRKLAAIVTEKETGKIVVLKKTEPKSIKNGAAKTKESIEKANFKNGTKNKTKPDKAKQVFVKDNIGKFLKNPKTEGEKRTVLTKTKNTDSLKNINKTMPKKSDNKSKIVLKFKEVKTDEKSPKIAINKKITDNKKYIVEKKNIENVKKPNTNEAEVMVAQDDKKVKNLKLSSVLETSKKGSIKNAKKKVSVETNINIAVRNQKNTDDVSLKADAAGTKDRKLSADSIKDKYAKRLNIKEVKVAEEDNKHTKKEISVKLNSNKPNEIKGNNSQTVRSTENAAINFDSQLQTVVNTVQKQNKTVKIKTLRDVKNNKVVKVVSFDVEDNKLSKPVGGHDAKTLTKDKAVKVNVHINDKALLKKPINMNMKTEKDLFVSKVSSKEVEILNTNKSKDTVESTLNISAHNLSNTHAVDMSAKNVAAHYPLDRIIENIDKMMKMKPPFNNTVTIKLEPPHIGVLELRIKMDKDKNISAFITAQDKDVVRLINAHTDGLKTYLNSQGIKVTHIDVHNGFNEQASFGGGQNQGMASGNQQNATGEHNFGSFGKSTASGEFSDTPKKAVYKNNLKLAGVDITV